LELKLLLHNMFFDTNRETEQAGTALFVHLFFIKGGLTSEFVVREEEKGKGQYRIIV